MTEPIADAIVHGLIGLLGSVLLLDFFARWKRNREVEPGILFLLMVAAVLGIGAGALHYLFPAADGSIAHAQVARPSHPSHFPAGCLIALGICAALAFYFKRRHRDIFLADEGRPTCFKTIVMKHRRHAVEGNIQLGYNAMLVLAAASLAVGAFVGDANPHRSATTNADAADGTIVDTDDPFAPPRTVAELLAQTDHEGEGEAAPEPEAADTETMAGEGAPTSEVAAPEKGKDTDIEPDMADDLPARETPAAATPEPSADEVPMATGTPSIGAPRDFNPATKRPRNIPKNVFASHIRPILKKHCFTCHGPKKQKGDLRLDTAEGIRKGGKNGAVAVAGAPEKSPLYSSTVLPPDDDDIMPAKGDPLSKKETELLRKWILFGADLGDGKHFADAGSGGAGFAVDQLADGIPSPDAALIESLKADGVLVRAVSANQSLLDLDFTHIENKNALKLNRLAPIAGNVHALDLTRSKVTDADLATITLMQNLVRLQLNQTTVGDDGLKHLQGLANLEILNLYSTRITDAGLAHLADMQKLQKLYLWESKATSEGAEKLKSKNPNLKIIF